MTSPHPSTSRPDDEDPTGVRDLLASLPDPGPMPPDLVARINASLEAEAHGRRITPAPGHGAPGERPIATVVPFDGATRRRPSGRRLFGAVLGAAAAVSVFGVVASNLVDHGQSSSSSAAANLNGDASSVRSAPSTSPSAPLSTSPSTTSQTDPGSAGAATAPLAPEAPAVQIRLARSPLPGGAALAAYGRGLLQSPWTPPTPHTVEQPGVGPIGTPTGVRECLAAVHGAASGRIAAEIGSYQGRPAVLIAVEQGSDRRQVGVYLASLPCAPAGAQLLEQPAVSTR
ncbi:hypothetical protein [Arsenicicoccus sp. oral taxon 190]|uniref:hypothetical protein n=1 Tax=Arsenicicoccus sp. oral taxon 190 TaxID=1658671 RepID=UPI00067A039C|nr:hypothetical protein [Arsenicicoccus sp. oral taxon 190]AKT50864.1 hypothetical protein ADJ73_05300 [Arsenicicoccus sp. oral taxon 190]